MVDKHEDALRSQLANLRHTVRDKEHELAAYMRSRCRVKIGGVVEMTDGKRYKVYAVEHSTGREYKLRCYKQKQNGTFGQQFCVQWLSDVAHVL